MDTGLRFKMPEQQKKNADVLLQEMFEDELEEDDIGPKDLDDLDELEESGELINERSGRKLTFLTVDADWRALSGHTGHEDWPLFPVAIFSFKHIVNTC